MDRQNIAGVVLAGGRSSRMGQDKALLDYNGRPLLDHMTGLLRSAGLADIYVSGDFEGYRCIPDTEPYSGPSGAIRDVLAALKSYDGILFVPVDMPFLTPEVLEGLLSHSSGAFYATHPLPFYIIQTLGRDGVCPELEGASFSKVEGAESVKELLHVLDIPAIDLLPEFEPLMSNLNTPEEWDEALRA